MLLFKKQRTADPVPQAFGFIEVDIHNHLIPGIDDGSPESTLSIKYIRELQQLGFAKFICTPHILPGVHNNTDETIEAAYQRLTNALLEQQISLPVHAAAEYMLDSSMFPAIKEKKLRALKDDYVLIEMSYMSAPPNLRELVFDLLIADYKPVLAHPERYTFYQNDIYHLEQLRDGGCLFQANLLSFTGYYGKSAKTMATYLLKNKLLDLVGTDLHHERHLAALKEMSKDRKLMEVLGEYGFRNRELFG